MNPELAPLLEKCAALTKRATHLAASATMLASSEATDAVDELDRALDAAVAELAAVSDRLDDQITAVQQRQVEQHVSADGPVMLNVGPGAKLASGWVNVDLAQGDVLADIRRQLPFPDGCASHIYCSHVLEHLRNPDEAHQFLVECRRVLRRGGNLRVVVPDIGHYMQAVLDDDESFWKTHQQTWPWSRGDANRLDLTLRYAGAGPNPGDFFGHQHGYNADSLLATMQLAGFAPVKLSAFQQSSDDAFHIDDQSAVAHVTHAGRPLSLFAEGFSIF